VRGEPLPFLAPQVRSHRCSRAPSTWFVFISERGVPLSAQGFNRMVRRRRHWPEDQGARPCAAARLLPRWQRGSCCGKVSASSASTSPPTPAPCVAGSSRTAVRGIDSHSGNILGGKFAIASGGRAGVSFSKEWKTAAVRPKVDGSDTRRPGPFEAVKRCRCERAQCSRIEYPSNPRSLFHSARAPKPAEKSA
jgi:hypothetical protein